MKRVLRNPISIWLVRLIKSKLLEYKYREKKLKIDSLVSLNNCEFGFYNTIYKGASMHEVQLSDCTYVGMNTKIANTKVGKFCSIGTDCKIGLAKHPSSIFVSTHPIFYSIYKQVEMSFVDKSYFDEYENIIIGNDVWIGANVVVLGGVTISDGAIIATGSVVTKDIPPYAICGGVPAKIINYRFKEQDISRLIELKWWNMDIQYLKKNFKKFHNIEDFLDLMSSKYDN